MTEALEKKTVNKNQVDFVLISLCTCKRPLMLRECLLSINNTEISENIKVEIIVVDNDSSKTAQPVVFDLADKVKYPIKYFVEEERGISKARNKVLDEAVKTDATHILFFDDDELLTSTTLKEHIKLYNENNEAYISSGPTLNKFCVTYPEYIKKNICFKQKTTKKTGQIRNNCAAGNVFFPISLIKDYGLRFSEKYVFMGGEDGEFFKRASELGFTIVWNNEAVIYEVVPPARANIDFVLKKSYYNGFAGVYYKFKNKTLTLKKFVYLLKISFTFMFNILYVIPSLLFGFTEFLNAIGMCFRTKGKIDGVLSNRPYNFYENIYGE